MQLAKQLRCAANSKPESARHTASPPPSSLSGAEAGLPPPPDRPRGREEADWPPDFPECGNESGNGHGQFRLRSPIRQTASFRAKDRHCCSRSPLCGAASVKARGGRHGPDPSGSCGAKDRRNCLQPLPPCTSSNVKSEAVPDQHSAEIISNTNEAVSIKSK